MPKPVKDFYKESTAQSKAKAKIVSDYFVPWAKVMLPTVSKASHSGRIAYIDLCTGQGRYDDGTMSTPLLILQSAVAEPEISKRLVCLLNDINKDSVEILKQEISKLPGIERLEHAPDIRTEEVGDKVAKELSGYNLVPTFMFVDPWGYKGLSLALINSVLKNWGCDCVFFFNYNRVNAGLSNSVVKRHMDVLFGEERAEALRKQVRGMNPRERERTIVKALSDALIEDGGGQFVLPFCFKDENGTRTSHYLIFVTKHEKGYRIMKEIMAKNSSEHQDGVASFCFTPKPRGFQLLFSPLDELEDMLLDEFAGLTLTTKEVYDRHNVGQRYIMKNYKTALLRMEAKKTIQTDPPSDKRKRNTFGDNVKVTFPKPKPNEENA